MESGEPPVRRPHFSDATAARGKQEVGDVGSFDGDVRRAPVSVSGSDASFSMTRPLKKTEKKKAVDPLTARYGRSNLATLAPKNAFYYQSYEGDRGVSDMLDKSYHSPKELKAAIQSQNDYDSDAFDSEFDDDDEGVYLFDLDEDDDDNWEPVTPRMNKHHMPKIGTGVPQWNSGGMLTHRPPTSASDGFSSMLRQMETRQDTHEEPSAFNVPYGDANHEGDAGSNQQPAVPMLSFGDAIGSGSIHADPQTFSISIDPLAKLREQMDIERRRFDGAEGQMPPNSQLAKTQGGMDLGASLKPKNRKKGANITLRKVADRRDRIWLVQHNVGMVAQIKMFGTPEEFATYAIEEVGLADEQEIVEEDEEVDPATGLKTSRVRPMEGGLSFIPQPTQQVGVFESLQPSAPLNPQDDPTSLLYCPPTKQALKELNKTVKKTGEAGRLDERVKEYDSSAEHTGDNLHVQMKKTATLSDLPPPVDDPDHLNLVKQAASVALKSPGASTPVYNLDTQRDETTGVTDLSASPAGEGIPNVSMFGDGTKTLTRHERRMKRQQILEMAMGMEPAEVKPPKRKLRMQRDQRLVFQEATHEQSSSSSSSSSTSSSTSSGSSSDSSSEGSTSNSDSSYKKYKKHKRNKRKKREKKLKRRRQKEKEQSSSKQMHSPAVTSLNQGVMDEEGHYPPPAIGVTSPLGAVLPKGASSGNGSFLGRRSKGTTSSKKKQQRRTDKKRRRQKKSRDSQSGTRTGTYDSSSSDTSSSSSSSSTASSNIVSRAFWLDVQTGNIAVIENILQLFGLDEYTTRCLLESDAVDSLEAVPTDNYMFANLVCKGLPDPASMTAARRRQQIAAKALQTGGRFNYYSNQGVHRDGNAVDGTGKETSRDAAQAHNTPPQRFRDSAAARTLLEDNASQEGLQEDVVVSAIVFEDWIITIHTRPFSGMFELLRRVQNNFSLRKKIKHNDKGSVFRAIVAGNNDPLMSSAWVFSTMVDYVIASFLPDPTNLLEEVDRIDEAVLFFASVKEDQKDLLRTMAALRKKISTIRATLFQKEKFVQQLLSPAMRTTFVSRNPRIADHYKHTISQIAHVAQRLDAARDVLSQANSNFVSGVSMEMAGASNQMNLKMHMLSQVASVCLPLNIITGLGGMNVTIPYQSDGPGTSLWPFWAIFCFMVAWVFLFLPSFVTMIRELFNASKNDPSNLYGMDLDDGTAAMNQQETKREEEALEAERQRRRMKRHQRQKLLDAEQSGAGSPRGAHHHHRRVQIQGETPQTLLQD